MKVFPGPLERIARHLKEVLGRGRPSPEGFQAELATLGLLGKKFTLEEYTRALGKHLDIDITIADYPDLGNALMSREVLREGNLAEVAYNADRNEAVIIVRESLRSYPWPTYELQLYHELSHLAAGHPLAANKDGLAVRTLKGLTTRLVRRTPVNPAEERQGLQEQEAAKRAKWLLLASTSPDIFEKEGTDQLT